MRIFLDANILFSAAAFEQGAVARLLALLQRDGHERWADGYVVAEAHRNLMAKKPVALRALADLLEKMEIATAATGELPNLSILAEALPEKDQPVLVAAIRCGCQALVTGDREHFGRLYGQTISGVAIHSPASLTEALFPG